MTLRMHGILVHHIGGIQIHQNQICIGTYLNCAFALQPQNRCGEAAHQCLQIVQVQSALTAQLCVANTKGSFQTNHTGGTFGLILIAVGGMVGGNGIHCAVLNGSNAPGTDDEEEMIRTMGEGLYAKSMGGGQVNPLTGDFTFGVAEGYWIKDGKILTPVRGAALVGKGSEVLLKIDRVGSKMWLGQGMCGAGSGSIPVALGQPRIRVSSMTVGGKGGAL